MNGFGSRLLDAMDRKARLCVGIDPHPALLHEWGLTDDPHGLREFSLRVVEELGGAVAALKPQSAFFERHGSRGIAVLEEVLAAARAVGTISILDVKRGDIGSTMTGYAEAYLQPGAPLEADAITVSPYLGPGSLDPAANLAAYNGKGLFVLALTSNPEGAAVQHARDADGVSVAAGVADWARGHNATSGGAGPIGLVVGATVGSAVQRMGLELETVGGVVLAPGFGEQGARLRDIGAVFGAASSMVLPSASRSILVAGTGNLLHQVELFNS